MISRNPEFRLEEEGGGYFFINASNGRVRTDRLGKIVWDSLPGDADGIIRRTLEVFQPSKEHRGPIASSPATGNFGQEDIPSIVVLAEDFLYVLFKANIIRSARPHQEHAEEIPLGLNEGTDSRNLVSAIVVTHNGASHIDDCFGSLSRQTFPDLEVIAIDNASQDGTAELIRTKFPSVRLFPLEKNIHFARAVNRGIEEARGKYFFILNQDIEVERDCVHRLHRRMKAEERTGAVVPMMKFYNLRGFINGIGNHIRERGWGSDNFIGCVDVGQFNRLKEVPSACFGAVLLSRDAVEEVGPLDGKYTAYYEDTDWSFRCWLAGWRIVPETKAIVYHKFAGSSPDRKKLRLVARNRQRLVWKVFRGRTLLRYTRNYFQEDVRNALALARKRDLGRAFAYKAAYVSFCLSLPGLIRERRVLARKRQTGLGEKDILAKNPGFFSCLDKQNFPTIDLEIIRTYYHPELRKIREEHA